MKRVYSSPNSLLVNHMRNLLEMEGISCFLRNELLTGAAGELPPTAVWPELWVKDDRDETRAREIVAAALSDDTSPQPEWTCRGCGERIEGQFDVCWNCGRERPVREK